MRWVRLLGWGLLAYTPILLFSISEHIIDATRQGQRINWQEILVGRSLEEYTCAACVPVLFWLSGRFPIDRQRWVRHLPILLVATMVLAAGKYVIFGPLFWPFWRTYWHMPIAQVPAFIAKNSFSVTLDFATVIAVAHAVQYYQRSRERERSEAAMRVRLSQAQLEALKSQLHPHFLFNTLNSVAALMHWDVAAADEMITQLSELLRETLRHSGTHEITLSEEIALIERYLSIVRARFQDRLTVVYDVAPDVRTALVPHFILQPLVENALEHGIALEPGPGRVAITAGRERDRLRIAVVDDGPGLEPGATNGDGVGLSNTRARLAELYGEQQALTLEAANPKGTRVTVDLPYHVPLASHA
jgi:two-component system, LytTR family, sensor kinase